MEGCFAFLIAVPTLVDAHLLRNLCFIASVPQRGSGPRGWMNPKRLITIQPIDKHLSLLPAQLRAAISHPRALERQCRSQRNMQCLSIS